MPGPGTAAADTHASSSSFCSWARPCISQYVDAAAPTGLHKLRWLSLSPTGRWPPFLQSRAWQSWGRTCWVGTRSEAPQQMPGPGTAADTHASSSSVCSWARPCISQYVDAADPTGQHKLRWLSLSSNRLTTIPAVRGLAWEPDQKHPNRCQGLAQLQTLTLAAWVSAVEPGLHQPICWRSRPYRTTQAPVAKLELKQVDHNSCSPGPRVGTRSEAPQQMPGPGTAADTHASSSSSCSWARPCISQNVDAADPTGLHKLWWLSLSPNRTLTTIPAVHGLAKLRTHMLGGSCRHSR